MATDADRIVALERLLKREKERNRKQIERLQRQLRRKDAEIKSLRKQKSGDIVIYDTPHPKHGKPVESGPTVIKEPFH